MSAIVYLATNTVNGKRYVGVTSRGFERRRKEHEQAPNAKRVTCRYFHAAVRKYGAASFDWMILAECPTFEAGLQEEIRLIGEIRPEYNLTTGGQGSKGRVVTQEQRAKHSQLMRGRKQSPEAIAKGVETRRGQKRTPEQRAKMSEVRKGIVFSATHIANLSAAQRGQKHSAETIAKRAAAHTGKPLSQEHRESIRATLRGRKRPPEVVAKMLESRRRFFENRKMEAAHGV